jgi:gamma-D-glutamyl-L-lysine dipeptidyl-peptidase
MSFVVCIVPVSPMRKEASHQSEMVNELLFGEIAESLEETNGFCKLRSLYDDYEGWCQAGQLVSVDFNGLLPSNDILTADWVSQIDINGSPMHLPLGSSLLVWPGGKGVTGNYSISYSVNIRETEKTIITPELIKKFSLLFLNTPYLWGGKSVFGIDCSGFVQQVYRMLNKKLPRDAYQQAVIGESVGFLQEAICGDLAFFDNEEGRINHVGLLLNADTIIHASGKVRIDKIDNMGIVNAETGERTHKLRIVKRVWGS